MGCSILVSGKHGKNGVQKGTQIQHLLLKISTIQILQQTKMMVLLPLTQVLLLVEMGVVRLSLLLWHRFKSGIRALCAVELGCVLPVKVKVRTGTATATSYALHATAICIAKNVVAEKATTPQNTDNQRVKSTILPLSPRIKHLGAKGEHYFLTGEVSNLNANWSIPNGRFFWYVSKCVDTLLFASKHAKGMSLRYDATFICAFRINWFLKIGFSPWNGERFFSFWRCHRPRLGGRS